MQLSGIGREEPNQAKTLRGTISTGCWPQTKRASHGENRGPSPLGSASIFKYLAGSSRYPNAVCLFFVYYCVALPCARELVSRCILQQRSFAFPSHGRVVGSIPSAPRNLII